MLRMLRIAALTFTTLLMAQGQPNQANNESLWAAISIEPTVFWTGYNRDFLQVHFTLLNDRPTTINPKLGSSHLLINGVEPGDWKDVVNDANRTPEFESLLPGKPLQFALQLGSYFTAPGTYTVGWWGEHFKAADLKIRVLPREQQMQASKGQASVWATISIQPSVSWRNQSDQFVCFSVVNDGPTPINPRSSHLLINGEEPRDWGMIVGNGLRSVSTDELPAPRRNELLPGRVEQFCIGLGAYVKKPGVYTVGWWGENFRAEDITIRVLPVDRFSFDGRPVN